MLVVGAASRDLTPDDPRGWRLGGAASYGSLTLGRLGVRTRAAIGLDAEAAEATELDAIRGSGVEVVPLRLRDGPVFRNIETPAGRRQHCLSESDVIRPERLPRGWALAADGFFLGPVAGELSDDWALVPRREAFVAVGWQGLLRRLVADRDVERVEPGARPLLSRADLIGVSAEDLDPAVRLRTLIDLVAPGSILVVTRGDRGGTLLASHRPARSSLHAYPAIPSNGLIDPTGAGDVFLAALVAAVIDGPRLGIGARWPDRLTFAAAAASLAVEAPGLAGVPTLDAVRRRVSEVA